MMDYTKYSENNLNQQNNQKSKLKQVGELMVCLSAIVLFIFCIAPDLELFIKICLYIMLPAFGAWCFINIARFNIQRYSKKPIPTSEDNQYELNYTVGKKTVRNLDPVYMSDFLFFMLLGK